MLMSRFRINLGRCLIQMLYNQVDNMLCYATPDDGWMFVGHGRWRCLFSGHVFSLCSLLSVLNSYIFPLVLNMHFVSSHTGKLACYVPCKCSHMHWLLSIFQQGLTNVIVSFFRPFFFPGTSYPLCLNPKVSLDFLAGRCQLSCLFPFFPRFFGEAGSRLDHEFKASRGAGLLRIFFFPA